MLKLQALVLLAACAASAWANSPVSLTTETFERLTQASTGQTTGKWLVLFTSDACDSSCKALSLAMTEYDPEEADEVVVMAEVDAGASPEVAKRFGLSQFPSLLLFRDRKMFPHPAPAQLERSETPLADLLSFVRRAGEGELQGLPVPAELSALDELVAKARKALEAVEGANPVYVAAGVGAVVVVLLAVALLGGKSKRD